MLCGMHTDTDMILLFIDAQCSNEIHQNCISYYITETIMWMFSTICIWSHPIQNFSGKCIEYHLYDVCLYGICCVYRYIYTKCIYTGVDGCSRVGYTTISMPTAKSNINYTETSFVSAHTYTICHPSFFSNYYKSLLHKKCMLHILYILYQCVV